MGENNKALFRYQHLEGNNGLLKGEIGVSTDAENPALYLGLENSGVVATFASSDEVYSKIEDEAKRAQEVEGQLWDSVNGEITRAQQVEEQLWGGINGESSRAQEVEGQLWGGINGEAARAQEVEAQLWGGINSETARAQEVEGQLWDSVNGEITRAQEVEAQLLEGIGTKQDAGDYAEYKKFVAGASQKERKTIQLANADTISGVKTTGEGVNLAMVSEWDVADFGSTQLPINLNGSEDHPKYNDNKVIALTEDLVNFATKEEVENAVGGLGSSTDSKFETIEQDISTLFDGVEYVSDAKKILFKHGEKVKAEIDATDFVKDGMVNGVEIKEGKLVITFNTDSGNEDIELELTQIFDASNYYTANEMDAELEKKQNVGDYVEYLPWVEGRKTIQLRNYDNISGIDKNGQGHNLVMLSKWDVADFGAPGVHFNINSKDRVTVNDGTEKGGDEIAYLSDVTKNNQDLSKLQDNVGNIKTDVDTAKREIEDIKKTLVTKQYVDAQDSDTYTSAVAEAKDYTDKAISGFQQNTIIGITGELNDLSETVDAIKTQVNGISNSEENGKLDDLYKAYHGTATKFFNGVKYDKATKQIQLLNGDEVLGVIDATDFIKDGMVDNVKIKDGKLVITFNIDAGKEDIELELTDIFDASNYYTKAEVDEKLEDKVVYTKFDGERKTISLANRDTISAVTPKGGSQIAMVSDYDGLDIPVVEIGGQKAALVLNSGEERVKVEVVENGKRVQHSVATTDDIEDVTKNVVKYEEPDMEGHGKFILLENGDQIMAKVNHDYEPINTKYDYVTVAQLNKWNCLDLGNKYLPLILNVPDNIRPVVQEASKSGAEAEPIAYLSEVNALKTLVEELKVYSGYDKGKTNVEAIEKGGDVYIMENFKATNGINIEKNTLVDLLDYEMSAMGDEGGNTVVIKGADVTLRNGKIKPADTAHIDYDANTGSSTVLIDESDKASHVTLENLEVVGGVYPVYLKNNVEGTLVVINSGTYYSNYLNNPAVYVQNGGKVTIEGGTFGKDGRTYPYLLNIKDSIRSGKDPREFIEVKGGTFINFDPSNNKAEGVGTNFVADGYEVKSAKIGNDIYYYVTKTNETLVSEFTNALKSGGDVKLEADATVPERLVMQKKGTVDLDGNTITSNVDKLDAMVITGADDKVEVTIKNGTFVSNNTDPAYGVITVQKNPKVILEDIEVVGINPIVMYSSGNGTITVNSGEYTSTGSQCVYYNKGAGKVTINGGYFKSTPYEGKYYTLNILDSLRGDKDPREFIEVKGGTFVNFDPSNNKAEGEGTNFVADGYHVEEKVIDENTTEYTVVKD